MNDLQISGYASRFGERDLSGDTALRGAFSASLLSRSDPFPMLSAHRTDQPIGIWDRVFEDDIGLYVEGRILAGSALSDSTVRLVREGAVSGLSIGYRARRSQPNTFNGRTLSEIYLWEVSVVAFPMLRSARILKIGNPSTHLPEHRATHQRRFA